MSLLLRVKALAEAVGADIKSIKTDPRLTDSREWSEDTVPQAEAEAGIASTRRAWTAQRVRQAINAWWQLVTSGFGRNFIAASNEQAARNVLQLTYPATAPTVGDGDEVMLSGAHGIGDVGTHASFITPTSLIYNSFWEGNCITVNSKASPYGSMLILQQNKLTYGTVNDADGIWAAEIITDKNQVVLGETAATARAALELGTAATKNVGAGTGQVMEVGTGGWMGRGEALAVAYGYPASIADVTNRTKVIRANVSDNGVSAYTSGIHFASQDTWGRLRVGYDTPKAWIQGGVASAGTGWTSQVVLSANLLQTTGTSTTFPMSQAATTSALSGKAALRATSNIDGGVRMRLDGTTLYITNDGSDA